MGKKSRRNRPLSFSNTKQHGKSSSAGLQQIRFSYPKAKKDIETFHSSGLGVDIAPGFRFHKTADMYIACNVNELDCPALKTHLSNIGVQGPSFQNFYKNMDKIVRGEWWVWPDELKIGGNKATSATTDDGEAKLIRPGDHKAMEKAFEYLKPDTPFTVISLLLCYDHFDFFTKQGINQSADIASNKQFQSYVSLALCTCKKNGEMAIPVREEYLRMYRKHIGFFAMSNLGTAAHPIHKDPSDVLRTFRKNLAFAWTDLQEQGKGKIDDEKLGEDFDDELSRLLTNSNVCATICAVNSDDYEKVRLWLDKGRIDALGMAKYMPNTSKSLSEGAIYGLVLAFLLTNERRNTGIDNSNLFNSIIHAANNVKIGLADTRQKCWECESLCVDKKKCAGCGAAWYCSRQCQITAWKSGHKTKCKELASMYKSYKNDVKIIDAYHNTKDTCVARCSSFEFQRITDMHIASMIAYSQTYRFCLSKEGLRGPSFDIFYQNIARVERGEWWFYEVDEDDLAYVGKTHGGHTFLAHSLGSPVDDTENFNCTNPHEIFANLSLLLCYDHFQYFAEKGINDTADFTRNHEFFSCMLEVLLCFREMNEGELKALPGPKLYLKLYKKLGEICQNDTSRHHKDVVAALFRSTYHK